MSARLASIWAEDAGGLLGTGTGMLWHVPADFAHFKASTMGAPIVMGRRSWESLGGALPGRTNIVVTRTPGYEAAGGVVAASLEEAIALARSIADRDGVPFAWITGGARVYAETLGLVDELVVTTLDLNAAPSDPDAPVVRAPIIDPEVWAVDESRSDADWHERSGDARWRVTTYVRR